MNPGASSGKCRPIIDDEPIIAQHYSEKFCAGCTLAARHTAPNRIHLISFRPNRIQSFMIESG